MRVCIPRALIYYNYYPFWFGFFKALGIEIVLSDKTTKQTMSNGSSLVVTETCLPIKVYVGHVLNLLDKGVDKIFVPSIQSVAHKIYNCSKIRALPDLIRNVVKREFTLIEATLDKSEREQGLPEFLKDIAVKFGIKDEQKVLDAQNYAWKVFNNYQTMTKAGVHFEKALRAAINGNIIIPSTEKEYEVSIALISHGYNIYDDRVSMKIFDKLDKLGVKVYTYEQLTQEQLVEGYTTLGVEKAYWANESEMTGAAGHYLRNSKIDGLITITAFGCGPDSIMVDRIFRNAKKFEKPVLGLTLDEHTGEAGFITRIEAFIDMLLRKKRVMGVSDSKIEKALECEEIAIKRPNFENIPIV